MTTVVTIFGRGHPCLHALFGAAFSQRKRIWCEACVGIDTVPRNIGAAIQTASSLQPTPLRAARLVTFPRYTPALNYTVRSSTVWTTYPELFRSSTATRNQISRELNDIPPCMRRFLFIYTRFQNTLCPKKTCDYILCNNFNNKCPITIIFGTVSSKSMRHRKMVSFPTSPI